MNLLVQLMMPALDFFYQMTGNYGLAIILLTLVIKIAFWQLTAKQYDSMAAMKKIQPKMKEIQNKHKSDPQKMNKELMVLYKEHGVNPFSGCLPILIQIPFMIALFYTLSAPEFLTKEGIKSFLWIKNIGFIETVNFSQVPAKHVLYSALQTLGLTGFNTSFVIGTYALPVLAFLVAMTTYFSQLTMEVEPEQKAMMTFMPLLMFFMCYNLNAGVLLYWVVSNSVTIFQQVYMRRQKLIKEEIAVAETVKK